MPLSTSCARFLTTSIFALLLTARSGYAQSSTASEPSLRAALSHLATKHGAWVSVGASRGAADLLCEVCTQDPTYAWALHGAVGIRLSPSVLLGVESMGWFDVFGDANRTASSLTLQLRQYAFGQRRPYVNFGAGIASYRVRDGEAGFRTRSPALSAGLGYDWRVGSTMLNPSVTALASVGGRLQSDRTDNAIDTNARLVLVRTGMAISWFR